MDGTTRHETENAARPWTDATIYPLCTWHPPASRAAQAGNPRRAYTYYESSPLRVCTTRRPLAFPLVRSEAAAWPRAFRLFSRTGFSAILEGGDAINGQTRGLARLATTFESTGHAASVLDLSCAIARPPCVKTGYCNSLLG